MVITLLKGCHLANALIKDFPETGGLSYPNS